MSRKVNLVDDVTVVIRSVNERTEAACHFLLAQQTSEVNIVIVNEAPFTAAIAKTFEVGIERGTPWTLVVDADVLVREGAIRQLLALAEQADDNLFLVQGRILDKFFSGLRGGGLRAYRTAFLPEALKQVPAEGVSIRPESYTMKQVTAVHGYSHIQEAIVLGLHDYEQSYQDIYRKAFVHAHKHSRHLLYLQPMWQRLAENDPDCQMALWGLCDGQTFDGQVSIDIRQFSEVAFARLLEKHDWQEKDQLQANALSFTDIDNLIETFSPPQEYWLGWYLKDISIGSRSERLKTVLDHVGLRATASWFMRSNWHKVARRLQTRFGKQ